MREDKLGDLSMELSVEVLRLTKELRAKHENAISNQIGRSLLVKSITTAKKILTDF